MYVSSVGETACRSELSSCHVSVVGGGVRVDGLDKDLGGGHLDL